MVATTTCTMTDDDVIATENNLEMMRRPHLWPCGNYLPLTKGHVGMDSPMESYAYLVDDDDLRTTIFIGLPFISDLKPKAYPSLEAIVADGWIVD